ncbi:origin of replication complex subunit 3-like [Zingiber officinale]|uniref:Origin of replication complex subunit 3 n=1 Tax=Zingiber officinale TaxID=94328 RepID=A0A8J5L9B0_ZINOF|nr:origin of replication complex subunit 3-like [Zingiber officinale]KAG6505181.1 hypothetical protein ZIOFF_037535 [Zingiber officinale]
MPSSATSDPPPSPSINTAAPATGDDLQPFFVLHKALSRNPEKKVPASAKRKIDLSTSSPTSADKLAVGPNHAIYEQLRLDAFNTVWSKIDSTINEVLRQINVSVFDEVHKWVLESFSIIKSCYLTSALEIHSHYPLGNDVICKQIPTAMLLTKNAEFVDYLLTFQELRDYLKSMGFHVANLSALDFSAKYGIAGCLRSLLRQLVMMTPDVADFSVLFSWYSEPDNYDHPIIIAIDDMERCSGLVLADFIRMLSDWVSKLPVIFVMGVASSNTARKFLPSDALQHLQPCEFTLASPFQRMNALVEAVLVKSCCGFTIGHEVTVFLRNYFLGHDATITSFIKALKLACAKHFSMETMSFLVVHMLDINYEVSLLGKCNLLPVSVLTHAFDLPSCKREKDSKSSSDDLAAGLSELRRLLKNWASVILCLYEVGKLKKMQLLDIFCEATDLRLSRLRSSNNKLGRVSSNSKNLIDGRLAFNGHSISQLIHTVRELPVASLSKVLDLWSIHTEEMDEIHSKIQELHLMVQSTKSCTDFQGKQVDCHRMKNPSGVGKTSFSGNDKAAALLDDMVRKFLIPVESRRFHEVVCFRDVGTLRTALIGNPRREIQVNLLKSNSYIRCSCCSSSDNALSPTMHDSSVMYNLAQEYGDLINLRDWYHAFRETVLRGRNNLKCRSPVSKKARLASESEASIQARFCSAVIELQITGLLRMPSKRRPDFVQRIAFGL